MEFLIPRHGNYRIFNKENITSGKVKVYWFPKQVQEDEIDPEYKPPPDNTDWPIDFYLLKHVEVIRVISKAQATLPDDLFYDFTYTLWPQIEGALLYPEHPEWAVYVTGGLRGFDKNLTYTGFTGGSLSGLDCENDLVTLLDALASSIGVTGWTELPGSRIETPVENPTTSENASPWTSNLDEIEFP